MVLGSAGLPCTRCVTEPQFPCSWSETHFLAGGREAPGGAGLTGVVGVLDPLARPPRALALRPGSPRSRRPRAPALFCFADRTPAPRASWVVLSPSPWSPTHPYFSSRLLEFSDGALL